MMKTPLKENFKGRGGGGRGRSKKKNTTENTGGMGSGGALLAGTGLGLMSHSGNNVRCPLDDNSFFCRLNRLTSTIGMIIYLIVIFSLISYLLYFAYSYFFKK